MTPTPWMLVALLLVPLAGATLLTWAMRQYAIRAGQLDRPNARSSHTQPTPRGGGVSFVVTTLVATLMLALLHIITVRHAAGVLLGGSAVAAVGLLDDRRGVAARWRFLTHMAATACILVLLDGWNAHLLSGLSAVLRAPLLGVALIAGVWLINLTNFMDGIDGIAATEAVLVSVGIAVCGVYRIVAPGTVLLPLILAAGALGFLVWNWPPARIFMGDAGSGFLGFCFAAFTFDAAGQDVPFFWCCLILLGVFITDATVTLLRRLVRGERVTEAHRTHGYQHASRRWRGHRPVTVTVLLINLIWLLPCALLVAAGRVSGPLALVLAYTPLVGLALWAGSGAPETVHGNASAVQRPN